MPDDYTDDTQTTGTVTVGGSVTGEIETGGDSDWFAVTLVAGNIYRFDLEGSDTNSGTLSNPYLNGIYDADGNYGNYINRTTDDDDGSGRNSRVTFRATHTATYYVSASGSRHYDEGTYTLSVTDVTANFSDDFTAWTDTTGTVTVGGSATGTIDFDSDSDWFAITLEAGKFYQFDLEGSGDGALGDPYLRGIYDAGGNYIRNTKDDDGGSGRNSRMGFFANTFGTYYVSAGANGDGEGAYRLSVREITDDFTDGTGTTGTVAVGGSATGSIEIWGDRDWFAVTLEAGKIYRFDLEGQSTRAGTLYDPDLRGIYDADGNLIDGWITTDDDDGSGKNSLVRFVAPADATYYVSASAGDQATPGTGTYRLSVREIADDFTAGTDTTGTVTVGGSATGEIQAIGDRDWFAVTLVAGQTYRFDLEGYNTSAGSLLNPYLRGIYDADGNLVDGTTDDNGGYYANSLVTFTATEDATYYVSAGRGSYNRYYKGIGTYTLSVSDVTEDPSIDLTAGIDTTGTVTVGGSATGEIETGGDLDWFAVTLVAGNIYRFDLERFSGGAHTGPLRDPYLYGIYDAEGILIEGTTNDNGGSGRNSRVTFSATTTGTYYVSAGAWNALGWNDDNGAYRLSVSDVTASVSDDFTVGLDTAGAVTVGGSATGEIDFGGDRDWFAVTLDAGNIYQFDLEGSDTSAGTLRDPYLHGIYDAGGTRIDGTTGDDGGSGWNSRVTFTATTTGTYYVSAGASGYGKGTYRLSVSDVTDDLSNDLTAATDTTGRVTVGGSATGEIDFGGDRDWFAVTLDAGNIYQFDLEGHDTSAGTLPDPYLYGIYDAEGNLVNGTTNDDSGSGWNSRVTFFSTTTTGTYYVSAGTRDPAGVGTYRLSVREIADDSTAGTDTDGAVTVGGSATGEIQGMGDHDWFAVTLEMGKTYRFDLEGLSTRAGTLWDPYLRGIYDAEGSLVNGTTNDNGGYDLNSRVTFTATAGATYYVSAGWGNFNEHQEIGTYTLSVRDVTDELSNDLTAATDTTGTVTVGGSATGSIDFVDDRDWFAVTLEAGKIYQFDLEGSGNRNVALYDPYLRGIYDAAGNYFSNTRNDDLGSDVNSRVTYPDSDLNSRVTFTASADAVHYVSAGAFRAHLGDYTLSVEEVM